MKKAICVFCSSSDAVDGKYMAAADELGRIMGQKGYRLIYGGTTVGLMGRLSRSVQKSGGKVTGIIPTALRHLENGAADELIVCEDLRSRKKQMEIRADAFIALPGGFGTLEEVMEIIALKQLNYHHKPVVFIDTDGFYKELKGFLEIFYKASFVKETYRNYYTFAPEPSSAISYIEYYTPPVTEKKWF